MQFIAIEDEQRFHCGMADALVTVYESMVHYQRKAERGSLVGIVSQADVVRKARNDSAAEDTVEKISEPGGRHAS